MLDDIPHPLDLNLAGKLVLLVEAGRHPSVVAIEKHAVLVGVALVGVVLAFGSTLGLAWLSFRFFQSPLLNLKERWTIPERGG